jgi:hypothetical protein
MTSSKKYPYQCRINDTNWFEAFFTFVNLDEISDTVKSIQGRRNPTKTFPEICDLVSYHHKALKVLDPSIFEIADLRYAITSNKDDVLKVSFSFTKLFGDEKETKLAIKTRKQYDKLPNAKKLDITLMSDKEPVTVSGVFTIMPGN